MKDLSTKPDETAALLSEGLHPAVLADVIDLGTFDSGGYYDDGHGDEIPLGPRPWIEFIFITTETTEAGGRKSISQRVVNTIQPLDPGLYIMLGSNLVDFLHQLGVKDSELHGLDLESLIGRQVQVLVQHDPG